jgi:hypothetical protein
MSTEAGVTAGLPAFWGCCFCRGYIAGGFYKNNKNDNQISLSKHNKTNIIENKKTNLVLYSITPTPLSLGV